MEYAEITGSTDRTWGIKWQHIPYAGQSDSGKETEDPVKETKHPETQTKDLANKLKDTAIETKRLSESTPAFCCGIGRRSAPSVNTLWLEAR